MTFFQHFALSDKTTIVLARCSSSRRWQNRRPSRVRITCMCARAAEASRQKRHLTRRFAFLLFCRCQCECQAIQLNTKCLELAKLLGCKVSCVRTMAANKPNFAMALCFSIQCSNAFFASKSFTISSLTKKASRSLEKARKRMLHL